MDKSKSLNPVRMRRQSISGYKFDINSDTDVSVEREPPPIIEEEEEEIAQKLPESAAQVTNLANNEFLKKKKRKRNPRSINSNLYRT